MKDANDIEVSGDDKAVRRQWLDEDDTCVSSISNVSDPNKEHRRIERRVSKACNGGVPKYVGDGDAKEHSKVLEEIIHEIKEGTSSPPPKEIDLMPPAIIPREHSPHSQLPDRSPSGSSSSHEKIPPRQGHRRTSVETPRIRSRRASIGGTTFYQTSHMAKIDTFLRGSELRLNKNGTCSFVFEEKKFEIETTAETSEFMFHCSLGRLAQWKKVWAKKLLHMMAIWNEEQITKGAREGNDHASRDSEEEEDQAEEDVGLLRIDSSKENPVVAIILYGHVDNVKNATHFQDKLDEFVDDALKFHDKLKAGPEVEKDKEVEPKRPPCKSQSCNTSSNTTSLTGSLTSSVPEGVNVASSKHLNQHESSPEGATPALSDSNDVSHGQDDHTSCKKSGVFAKMIKSLRSKHKEDIGKLAFVDPNQNSAFVVDTSTADNVKIKISRQSSRRESTPIDDKHQPRSRRCSAHTEDDKHQLRSRSGSAHTDEIQPKSHLKRESNIDDGHRVNPKKGSSFNVDDRPRGPSKKSTSFFHDDFSGGIYYPAQKGASYRVEERKSSSLHTPQHSHSDRRVSSPDTLNASACNLSHRDRCRSSRFNKSEPALAQNRNEIANPTVNEYRRHQTSEHHRRRRASSRPLRKVHRDQPSSAGGKEEEKSHSRSRRIKSQAPVPPAPPSRPPDIGRSRSRSALRKNGHGRSRSALRTE